MAQEVAVEMNYGRFDPTIRDPWQEGGIALMSIHPGQTCTTFMIHREETYLAEANYVLSRQTRRRQDVEQQLIRKVSQLHRLKRMLDRDRSSRERELETE